MKAKDLKVGQKFRTSMGNVYKLLEPVGSQGSTLYLRVEGRKSKLPIPRNAEVTLLD